MFFGQSLHVSSQWIHKRNVSYLELNVFTVDSVWSQPLAVRCWKAPASFDLNESSWLQNLWCNDGGYTPTICLSVCTRLTGERRKGKWCAAVWHFKTFRMLLSSYILCASDKDILLYFILLSLRVYRDCYLNFFSPLDMSSECMCRTDG